MGLFDDLKKQNNVEAPLAVDHVAVAQQGIIAAERRLEVEASLPGPGLRRTPPGVELLRLARTNPRLDEESKAVFLEALLTLPNEHRAALAAGVTVLEARKARREDPGFAAAWDHAVALATGAAESEAWRRAVDGVPKKVFYQGQPIDVQHEYSDALLTRILAAHEPKYEPRSNIKAEGSLNINWLDLVKAMHEVNQEK